jgi:hypothetical protein
VPAWPGPGPAAVALRLPSGPGFGLVLYQPTQATVPAVQRSPLRSYAVLGCSIVKSAFKFRKKVHMHNFNLKLNSRARTPRAGQANGRRPACPLPVAACQCQCHASVGLGLGPSGSSSVSHIGLGTGASEGELGSASEPPAGASPWPRRFLLQFLLPSRQPQFQVQVVPPGPP